MSSPRKGIAIVIADLGSGGAQQVASRIANRWVSEGRRISVITLDGPEGDFFALDPAIERIVIGGIDISKYPLEAIRNNLKRIKALRLALQEFGGKVAIGFIAPMNIQLVLASRGLGYRTIISERNNPAKQSFGRLWDMLRQRLYPMADVVTANSHNALEVMKAYVPSDKLAFVPNPVRFELESLEPNKNRAPFFLNVGRLHPQKGQDLLIEAFHEVQKHLPEWQLKIAGEGQYRLELERLIDKLGLCDRVELCGVVADTLPYYQQAGVFVFPSRYEGFPNALMEAMATGAACIATNSTPGHLELIRDNENGVIVPGEDPHNLAEAMLSLAEHPHRRMELGVAAAQSVKRYALDNVIEEWNHLLSD